MSVSHESPKARIELELVLGADPISGTIRDSAGSERSFHGWLELLGALERIRGPNPGAWGDEEPSRSDEQS